MANPVPDKYSTALVSDRNTTHLHCSLTLAR
jgi:hypothetical protein